MTKKQGDNKGEDDHGGQWHSFGCSPSVDLSVNNNPLGMPRQVRRTLEFGNMKWEEYPEILNEGGREREKESHAVKSSLAQVHQLNTQQVYVGSGCTEILADILRCLEQTVGVGRVLTFSPTYTGYEEICRKEGYFFQSLETEIKRSELETNYWVGPNCWEQVALNPKDVFILGNPNSPTGDLVSPDSILEKAKSFPKSTIVIDESYIDFLPNAESYSLCRYKKNAWKYFPSNVWIVKSLTKFFSIPGIRLGIAYGCDSNIQCLKNRQLPWAINSAAQTIAPLLYQDSHFLRETKKSVQKWKELFLDTYKEWEWKECFKIYSSPAVFFWIELKKSFWETRFSTFQKKRGDADSLGQCLQKCLLENGVGIRAYAKSSLWKNYIRIRVGNPREQRAFFNAVSCICDGKSNSDLEKKTEKRASSIMVVGTSSGAGKSLVTTAICRMLYKKGYKVAPFKGQNMSNNAAVTRDGLEMGRAQYVQAQAAGIEPHVDMNPVLLKPSGTRGCQVVVCGKVVGNQSVQEYYGQMRFEVLREKAYAAYNRLASNWDVIVLEGAGSPAEINLETKDFTNLDMAIHADASVILVADIERGGVFASIFGTVRLLQPHHQKLIKGILINKFRGDAFLLQSGIEEVERTLNIPVLGVLPWDNKWNLEEEDSLTLVDKKQQSPSSVEGMAELDLVVVHLPNISNHTDFQPFEKEIQVRIRYVQNVEQLGNPDLIWIPGSKNVIEDLQFLKESGWGRALQAAANRHIPIMGVCGGYQMMGQEIRDPKGIEGIITSQNKEGCYSGLGLLPIVSELDSNKKTIQVKGVSKKFPFVDAGTFFTGYEIHCGKTTYVGKESLDKNSVLEIKCDSKLNLAIQPQEHEVASRHKENLVWGCYIHGIFEQSDFCESFLRNLWERKGFSFSVIQKGEVLDLPNKYKKYSSQETIEKIAKALEKYVNVHQIESWCIPKQERA